MEVEHQICNVWLLESSHILLDCAMYYQLLAAAMTFKFLFSSCLKFEL